MKRTKKRTKQPDKALQQEVGHLLYGRGYDITMGPLMSPSHRADLVARRKEAGRLHTIAIDFEVRLNFENIRAALERATDALKNTKLSLDEYWIVVSGQFSNIVAARGFDKRIQIFEIEDLREKLSRQVKPSKARSSRARTTVGKAVEASEKEIKLAISGLILQIDEKLDKLGDDRPNSEDARAKIAADTSDLERMKAELERIRELVMAFNKGKAPEKDVVQSVKTFKDDIQHWWDKEHDGLLTSAAKSTLFVSSVGVLALMKADTPTAIAIAGALIGGKVIKTIKKVGKKMLGGVS
ncbi:hypothetical protein [Bradyrhizobium prioriisuperbiae]|uniref:hypothetical protein n=1 Tax=Bradyrhizobium prioriisuperbiae TaxID=2854389 RepID=UPI0028E57AAE|nr:hypothetical protein [Bradyrhizobium prioritasuperba]